MRYGSARLRPLEFALRAVDVAARVVRAVASTVLYLPRLRSTDLYAAAQTARFHAAHGLIDKTADAADDGQDVTVVAARTWPWLGAGYVYQEDDQ